MNDYELILIFDPASGEEKIDQTMVRVEEKIKGLGGEVQKTEKWGVRKLASMLKKAKQLTQGYYILVHFRSAPGAPSELRVFLRVTENVLRYFISRAVAAAEEKIIAEAPQEAVEVGEIKGEPLGESQ